MKLTGKQQKALGLMWDLDDLPNKEAIEEYFNYTDRGIKTEKWRTNQDLYRLLFNHRTLPIIVEMWKDDFKKGLLFLSDFENDRQELKELAVKIYLEEFGYIPGCYERML